MAMEVASKRIHNHALGLAMGLFAIMGFSAFMITSTGNNEVKALVTQVIHVQTGSNGLAHVSLDSPEQKLGATGQEAGKTMQRDLLLQSAANDN